MPAQEKLKSAEEQIRVYLQTLKQDPRSRVFAPLAQLLLDHGYAVEAEKICRRGLREHPEFSEGFLVLAQVLYSQGRLEEASQQLEKSLQLNPQSVRAHLLSAELLRNGGDTDGAVQSCMRVLDIDPANPDAVSMLAALGASRRMGAKSASQVRRAAATAPGRRRDEPGQNVSAASLFGDNLLEVSQEAIEKVESESQPFSALSSGSHPPPADEEFSVPTVKKLPTPVSPSCLARISKPPSSPQAPAGPAVSPSAGFLTAEYVQSVIDRLGAGEAVPAAERLHSFGRGRAALVFFLLLAVALLAGVFKLGLRSAAVRHQVQPGQAEQNRPPASDEAVPQNIQPNEGNGAPAESEALPQGARETETAAPPAEPPKAEKVDKEPPQPKVKKKGGHTRALLDKKRRVKKRGK